MLTAIVAPWYQPETTYQIFNRVMFDKDVATGQKSTARGGYSTNGPDNVFDITNAIPSHPVSECYLWDIFQTCTELQTDLLRNGTAILEDFIMIGHHTADGTTYYYEGR
jgi:carboxypeptidase D